VVLEEKKPGICQIPGFWTRSFAWYERQFLRRQGRVLRQRMATRACRRGRFVVQAKNGRTKNRVKGRKYAIDGIAMSRDHRGKFRNRSGNCQRFCGFRSGGGYRSSYAGEMECAGQEIGHAARPVAPPPSAANPKPGLAPGLPLPRLGAGRRWRRAGC
jgi:hypothetical protein